MPIVTDIPNLSFLRWYVLSFNDVSIFAEVSLHPDTPIALVVALCEHCPRFFFSSLSTDLGTAGWDQYYGTGRVDAGAAVLAAAAAQASDATAPTVAISAPAGATIVSGLVPVDVSAFDNVGVSRVDLVVNGNMVASDTSAPYAFSWDSTKVADGAVALIAYAYDAAGNYAGSTAVNVSVKNTVDTMAPWNSCGRKNGK